MFWVGLLGVGGLAAADTAPTLAIATATSTAAAASRGVVRCRRRVVHRLLAMQPLLLQVKASLFCSSASQRA